MMPEGLSTADARDLMVNLDIPVQVPAKEDFKLLPPP
ncbi:MAG: hypothetical protein JWP03_854 [Phycisphaerales bacterium]|jgi:hypothetical protein|nr:hypothetical protein [Phycisphaerales bacterium]